MRLLRAAPAVAAVALALAASAAAAGDAGVAALQVALRAHNVYAGDVDGIRGPATEAAVRELAGRSAVALRTPSSAHPLLAPRSLGSRLLPPGSIGWDVAEAQFLLAWHGFPSGPISGRLGDHTVAAVRRFQRFAGLPVTGTIGPLTIAALRRPLPVSPLPLAAPLDAPVSGSFGPRGNRFHAGLDYAAAAGTPVRAAGPGRVVYAGWRDGGFGYHVAISHGNGVRTTYSHLERVDVQLGQRVEAGDVVGAVGATGESFGPHLHFEARLRGAAVDPATAVGAAAQAVPTSFDP